MLPLERKVSLAETLSRFVYQPGPNDSFKRNSKKSCKGSAEAVTSTITPTSLIIDEDIANGSSAPTNEVRQVSLGRSRAHAKRGSEEGLDNPSKKRLGKPARSSRPVDHADLSVLTDRLKEGLDGQLYIRDSMLAIYGFDISSRIRHRSCFLRFQVSEANKTNIAAFLGTERLHLALV
jgi:hypothetical protein